MTKKSMYVGKESGKSSTKWFGPSTRAGTESSVHGFGARAGDGRKDRRGIIGKIEVIFRDK